MSKFASVHVNYHVQMLSFFSFVPFFFKGALVLFFSYVLTVTHSIHFPHGRYAEKAHLLQQSSYTEPTNQCS